MLDIMKYAVHTTVEVTKASPVVLVLYWNAFVAAVPTLTMILALLYLILQIWYLAWKWNSERKDRNTIERNKDRDKDCNNG